MTAQIIIDAVNKLQIALVASPAIKAVAGVTPQSAHPAYPARPAVLAANNTTSYVANELYKGSPAYPIGTAIPAIPAKAATAVVQGVSAVAAQAARLALPFYDGKVSFEEFDDGTNVSSSIDVVIPLRQNPVDSNALTFALVRPNENNRELILFNSVDNPSTDYYQSVRTTQIVVGGAVYLRIEGELIV